MNFSQWNKHKAILIPLIILGCLATMLPMWYSFRFPVAPEVTIVGATGGAGGVQEHLATTSSMVSAGTVMKLPPPEKSDNPQSQQQVSNEKKEMRQKLRARRAERNRQKTEGRFKAASELRLVFLHIRKTGGTTLWSLLKKTLPAKFRDPCLCSIKSPPMYESRCREEAQEEFLAARHNNSYSPFVSESDIVASGGLDSVYRQAGFSADWLASLSDHKRRVLLNNIEATSQVKEWTRNKSATQFLFDFFSFICVGVVVVVAGVSSNSGKVSSSGTAPLGHLSSLYFSSAWLSHNHISPGSHTAPRVVLQL